MIKGIMRRLGWVPLEDYAQIVRNDAKNSTAMRAWADEHEARSEDRYRKLAEQLAETREALYDRKQLHHLQGLMIDRAALLPTRPAFLKGAHNAHLTDNERGTPGDNDAKEAGKTMDDKS
jgi:hypothetical protein